MYISNITFNVSFITLSLLLVSLVSSKWIYLEATLNFWDHIVILNALLAHQVTPFMSHSHWLRYTNPYFVKSPSSIFGLIGPFPRTWSFSAWKKLVAMFTTLLMCSWSLVLETKLWVRSNWLMSSSKLQLYLVLCRFAQALLETKFARWKEHSFMGD
jgi:hypothetical protein